MITINDFEIDKYMDTVTNKDLQFLKLTGYETYYSQGIYGQDVIIAVADTGVSPHKELQGRTVIGKSFVDYTNSFYDDNGHGTHVAASVAGKNVGVASMSNILSLKVLDKDGYGNLDDLVNGLYWLNDYKTREKANIAAVNLSLSADKSTDSKIINELHEVVRILVANDIAVIASAGNTGQMDVTYPSSYDESISVGAVDIKRKRALFSTMGNFVDLCQVGVDVVSAWYQGGYAAMSGTSMSTAIISGIAALISSKYIQVFNESITEDYLYRSLKLNTKDLGIKGTDMKYGAGFCTLQPLDLDMRMKNNSRKMYVNGKSVSVSNPIDFDSDRISMPFNILSGYTGAYSMYDEDAETAEFLY